MQLSDLFLASDDVVSREVGGEFVLLDLASGMYFGLDPVGGRIWELLSDRAHSLAELCDVIEAEFDAPREQIESDMIEIATALREKSLIVVSDS